MRTPRHLAAGLFALALGAFGCANDRALSDEPNGAHPAGWGIKESQNFHGSYLKLNRFPLSRCQTCHGADFAGGPAKVSCSQGTCHAKPPSDCATCHGANGLPRPTTGAHQPHAPYCDTCHVVPTPSEIEKHASGDVASLIHFGGVAVAGNKSPTWNRDTGRCANTYCHGALSPVWTDPTKIQCDSCHGTPPDSHKRWGRLAVGLTSCSTCHPPSTEPSTPRHRNGVVDLVDTVTCTTCHGEGARPSPPRALDGSSDPTTRGVGAHQRHLEAALPDRIAAPTTCNACHQVPKSVLEPGHLDTPETRVRFPFGGSYDAATGSCTVWCHFDRNPGPVWTNASGSARACDGCHAFPPVTTRKGTPHPSVAPDVEVCKVCHAFTPATHVNGVVEYTR